MSFPLIFSLARENWAWEVLSSYRERQHNDSPEMLNIFNIKNVSVHLPEKKYLTAIALGIYRVPWRPEDDGARCKAGGAARGFSQNGTQPAVRGLHSVCVTSLHFPLLTYSQAICLSFAIRSSADIRPPSSWPTPGWVQWSGDHIFPVISSLADSVQVL